jgi:hypothetical protein
MRPKTFTFSPVTASVTGFASNVTGGTWTLSTTATSDGLGHQVTIKNDAATNHSAKTAVLVGTDADGLAITETMNLPNNAATTTSTKFFKTLTSITPSATINADTMDIGWAAPSISQTYVTDWPNVTNGGISLFCIITGTINYDVEHTVENVFGSTVPQSLNWLDHSSIVAKTASSDGNYAFPVTGVRFKTNSVTNGATVSFTVAQGRP